jgi:hypothetical protein
MTYPQQRAENDAKSVAVRQSAPGWGKETLLALDRGRVPHVEAFIAALDEGVLADQGTLQEGVLDSRSLVDDGVTDN